MAAAVSYDQPDVHQIRSYFCSEIMWSLGAARRMHPDRNAQLVHFVQNGRYSGSSIGLPLTLV